MTMTLMFQGTGSNVGKSILVAGLCRAFSNRGLKVLPFKPQNMSNNAAVAQGANGHGGEIGRAQWLQALACRAQPDVDMNPVLLKPQSPTGSQIIVQGKMWKSATAREYQELRRELLKPINESFTRLKSDADLVLIEGAGSPAETNLRDGDIANMGFALEQNIPVIMIGDIDRGGVIASLVGTHLVLDKRDKEQIKGFVINKFRGDVSLFDEGIEQIKSYTQWRNLGVVPWLSCVSRLPEEDSVWFDSARNSSGGSIKIAVPVFGKVANFDDLDPLLCEPQCNLVFVQNGNDIPEDSDLVILTGSKSTISDMGQMWKNGWAKKLQKMAAQGVAIIGICGGYQMLGHRVTDPSKIEGDIPEISGLGLLDVDTILEDAKTVRVSKGFSNEFDVGLEGYEIHLGQTTGNDCTRPMVKINGEDDGAISVIGLIRGCYLHGLFANDEYRHQLIQSLGGNASDFNYAQSLESSLDELAAELENHLDLDAMLTISRKAV